MAVQADGRIIVEDMLKRALVILAGNGESLSELMNWELLPPQSIVSVDMNHIAGCAIGYDMESLDLSLIFKPTLYPLDDTGRELEFFADTLIIVNALEANDSNRYAWLLNDDIRLQEWACILREHVDRSAQSSLLGYSGKSFLLFFT